jgi:hypothetical protein
MLERIAQAHEYMQGGPHPGLTRLSKGAKHAMGRVPTCRVASWRGRIHVLWGERFMREFLLTDEDVAYVIWHEMAHMKLRHQIRAGFVGALLYPERAYLWNLGADLEVEQHLEDLRDIRPEFAVRIDAGARDPLTQVTFDPAVFQEGERAEDYYVLLRQLVGI